MYGTYPPERNGLELAVPVLVDNVLRGVMRNEREIPSSVCELRKNESTRISQPMLILYLDTSEDTIVLG